jgi:hypothetical protein
MTTPEELPAIAPSVYTRAGVEPGAELPSYAWPGGYQLAYYSPNGDTLCPACANRLRLGLDTPASDNDRITMVDAYYEGPPIQCANCNEDIESAYGDPDADEPTEPTP